MATKTKKETAINKQRVTPEKNSEVVKEILTTAKETVKKAETKRDETLVKCRCLSFYAGAYGVYEPGKFYEMPKWLALKIGDITC